jgi:hypothetical protein
MLWVCMACPRPLGTTSFLGSAVDGPVYVFCMIMMWASKYKWIMISTGPGVTDLGISETGEVEISRFRPIIMITRQGW